MPYGILATARWFMAVRQPETLVLRGYRRMARWAVESQPSADLTPVDLDPQDRGDGTTVQRFKTAKGVIHAKVVEPSGHTLWYIQLREA